MRRFLRHAWQHGRKNPVLSYLFYENRARLARLGRKHSKVAKRSYVGGRDILDPQYSAPMTAAPISTLSSSPTRMADQRPRLRRTDRGSVERA